MRTIVLRALMGLVALTVGWVLIHQVIQPVTDAGSGGQRADPDFDVSIAHPAYVDKHPAVLFDEAHHNFHTASGRYKVFADLITNDGYRITPGQDPFTPERLARFQILVIANATSKSGPPNSAFTKEECDSVQSWVKAGGSLLLITDHEPFGSASAELGKRFGVEMSMRTTFDPANETECGLLFSRSKDQIGDHPIMAGRNDTERVDRLLTFTGQSLKGPPESIALLKFADTAIEGQTISAGRPSPGRGATVWSRAPCCDGGSGPAFGPGVREPAATDGDECARL